MLGSTATTIADQSTASANARFVIHAMTLNSGQSCKSDEHYKMVSLNGMEEASVPLKVSVCFYSSILFYFKSLKLLNRILNETVF